MKSFKLFPILLATALFACDEVEPIEHYTVSSTASPQEGGTVYLSPGWLDSFEKGQKVAVIPVANENWVFQQWEGDADGNSNPFFISMNSDKNIIGVFVRKEYTLDIEIIGEGTVTETIVQNPSGREYSPGTTVELNAIPAEGWLFRSWGGYLNGDTNPIRIGMDEFKKVTVRFIPKPVGEPKFYLAENGITCKCDNVYPGQKGFINGVQYEAVDDEYLRQRVGADVDLTRLCTSLVTNMAYLFRGGSIDQPIGNWDVSNVTNMEGMFAGIWGPTDAEIAAMLNEPLGFWGDPDELVTKYRGTTFNQPIGNWNVNKVTNMSFMFFGSNFDQPLENWDVSSVTNMSGMFGGISEKMPVRFRQNISEWDVGNVTNMEGMFVDNHYFNHDLSNWCVEKIPTIPKDFSNSAWILPKPVWGTCPD